eukprot:TRINITY_DN16072_c0_g3_i2.p1 TRINITY_DN16072_c0_g3~~TRINITY_DN16072_c0_g3_i2.p1  ORF type:complete len:399 (-),score=59.74 TRINITY_DN16072_c0_g3_i2:133-1329(-)
MRFKIEEIVHPDSQMIAQEFLCSICMCIVNEPSQTVCDHMFCAECVAPCLACPTCRTTLGDGDKKPLRECNKPMLRMMSTLKVWCPYHEQSKVSNKTSAASTTQEEQSGEEPAAKRARAEQGGKCEWTGSYIDLLAKHLAECPFHVIPCPRGCGKMLVRRDLEHHEPECAKNFEECPICRDVIKVGLMGQHRKEKAELHVQLLEAKLAEKESRPVEEVLSSLRDRLTAVETAVKRSATKEDVNRVETAVKRSATKEDVKACVDARVASLSESIRLIHLRKVEWKISDFNACKRVAPKGSCMKSKDFNLPGHGPFRIVFFPNGNRNADVGKCSIFLEGPEDIKAKVTITVGQVSLSFPDFRSLANFGHGWPNFCASPTSSSLLVLIEITDIQVITSLSE